MIDTTQQTTCKVCGKPLVQKESRRGHRKRRYCSDQCKQAAYRQRKEQPQDVTIVTIDGKDNSQARRIAELEQEVSTLEMLQGKRKRGKERAGLQRRLIDTGKGTGYQAITIRITIGKGIDVWRLFAKDASEDMLARAIVAAGGS